MSLARLLLVVALTLSTQAQARPRSAAAARPPTRVGVCVRTRIDSVHQRLDAPDSGSAVELRNGVYGVSYDQVPAVNRSRRGDPVITCLATIPRHCPRGDTRGREYRTTNLRTHESWLLPDSQHMCGGA